MVTTAKSRRLGAKVRTWLWRYGPAELLGTVLALVTLALMWVIVPSGAVVRLTDSGLG